MIRIEIETNSMGCMFVCSVCAVHETLAFACYFVGRRLPRTVCELAT